MLFQWPCCITYLEPDEHARVNHDHDTGTYGPGYCAAASCIVFAKDLGLCMESCSDLVSGNRLAGAYT